MFLYRLMSVVDMAINAVDMTNIFPFLVKDVICPMVIFVEHISRTVKGYSNC